MEGGTVNAASLGRCLTCDFELRERMATKWGTGMSPTRREVKQVYCLVCEGSLYVPKSFRWSSFESPLLFRRVKPELIGRAKEALDGTRVVLCGPAGLGKTSLAAAMYRRRIEHGGSGYWASAWRLGVARAQYALGAGEPAIVQEALAASIMVLDDLGCERNTPTNAVPDVVFARHEEGLTTWVTTAMTPQTMAERYGDGIARRVFEGATIIDCGISDREDRRYGT